MLAHVIVEECQGSTKRAGRDSSGSSHLDVRQSAVVLFTVLSEIERPVQSIHETDTRRLVEAMGPTEQVQLKR
jgi:hypothetical protein